MEILLTGANGFLGKSIVNELSKENTLYSLSRTSGEYKVSLDTEIPNFEQKFDLIVHAAGKAHSVPKTEVEKQVFYNVNVIGTQNLLKALENAALPKQFVYISSVSVYGLNSGSNINENYPVLAEDPYGLSKIKAEQLVSNWCVQNEVVCTILRLPLLVGSHAPGNLGAMVKAIEKGYYFNIGGGSAKKSMILAQDVARFIPLVAPLGGIYNMSDGSHPSFKELSTAISINKNKKIAFNLPLGLVKILGYLGDVLGGGSPINSLKVNKITSTLTFDDSKARAVQNWKPQSVLEFLKENSL